MTTAASPSEKRNLRMKPYSKADRVFFGIANLAAYSAIVIIALILIFLLQQGYPTFAEQGVLEFVFGTTWSASEGILHIGPMLYGSLLIAGLGVLIAVPMAISVAYFIVFMAPQRLSKFATILVDLLAAFPSIVVGLWGVLVFGPVASSWAEMLHESLGWLPFFAHDSGTFNNSPFVASIVIGIMIVPLIASVTREIFSQMDQEVIKASLALGGNNESTFRKVILPTSAGGILGGVLLGLGRALGETVAIYFVLNLIYDSYNWYEILEPEGGNIASLILATFGEATPAELNGLMAAGVVLFVITLIVNAIASYIVAKAQPWRKL
ncbi:MAG: phosphate transporter permease subunit PstC [Actinomycetota bacterium]|jgi:phosphate transport system permease protein